MELKAAQIPDFRRCLLLAMDFITAHRVAKDHAYDVAAVTAAPDTLEQRVLLALRETDESAMPEDWSWRHAAHEIAVRAAMAIVEEERESK